MLVSFKYALKRISHQAASEGVETGEGYPDARTDALAPDSDTDAMYASR